MSGDERAETEKLKKEVESLQQSNQHVKALTTAITAPNAKDDNVRLISTSFTCAILAVIKEADIGKTLDSFNEEDRSTILKYVYRGMATGQNCTALLKWHAAIYERDGVGAIMRVLVDRRS